MSETFQEPIGAKETFPVPPEPTPEEIAARKEKLKEEIESPLIRQMKDFLKDPKKLSWLLQVWESGRLAAFSSQIPPQLYRWLTERMKERRNTYREDFQRLQKARFFETTSHIPPLLESFIANEFQKRTDLYEPLAALMVAEIDDQGFLESLVPLYLPNQHGVIAAIIGHKKVQWDLPFLHDQIFDKIDPEKDEEIFLLVLERIESRKNEIKSESLPDLLKKVDSATDWGLLKTFLQESKQKKQVPEAHIDLLRARVLLFYEDKKSEKDQATKNFLLAGLKDVEDMYFIRTHRNLSRALEQFPTLKREKFEAELRILSVDSQKILDAIIHEKEDYTSLNLHSRTRGEIWKVWDRYAETSVYYTLREDDGPEKQERLKIDAKYVGNFLLSNFVGEATRDLEFSQELIRSTLPDDPYRLAEMAFSQVEFRLSPEEKKLLFEDISDEVLRKIADNPENHSLRWEAQRQLLLRASESEETPH